MSELFKHWQEKQFLMLPQYKNVKYMIDIFFIMSRNIVNTHAIIRVFLSRA